jgi:hypothetical protein
MALSPKIWTVTLYGKGKTPVSLTVIQGGIADIFEASCKAQGKNPIGSAYELEEEGFSFSGLNKCSGYIRSTGTPQLSPQNGAELMVIHFPSSYSLIKLEIHHEKLGMYRMVSSGNLEDFINKVKSVI